MKYRRDLEQRNTDSEDFFEASLRYLEKTLRRIYKLKSKQAMKVEIIDKFEQQDVKDGIYEANFYEAVEVEK